MPTTDPIADLLTRVRNALKTRRTRVDVPFSKMKAEVTRVLMDSHYIHDFVHVDEGPQGYLRLYLKYSPGGEPAIQGLRRISRPGLRRYVGERDIPRVMNGLGVSILSTSRGVMTGNEARRQGLGGEVVCHVW
ncbi:30S ribosomal protein S8 [bacterium]|nr:30S ribosomal protein S8 [bacterium]MBU1984429.1 30S ribosomal protein S8 [bacterium]